MNSQLFCQYLLNTNNNLNSREINEASFFYALWKYSHQVHHTKTGSRDRSRYSVCPLLWLIPTVPSDEDTGKRIIKKRKKQNRVRLFHGRLDRKFISDVTLGLMSVNTFPAFFELSARSLWEESRSAWIIFFAVMWMFDFVEDIWVCNDQTRGRRILW